MPENLSPYEVALQTARLRRWVTCFRWLSFILGGYWLTVGIVGVIAGPAMLLVNDNAPTRFGKIAGDVVGVQVLLHGVGLLVAGMFTLRKQQWAFYLGLTMLYIDTACEISYYLLGLFAWEPGKVVNFVAAGLMIGLTHIFIRLTRYLRLENLPLTIRPEMIRVPAETIEALRPRIDPPESF